MGWRCAHSRVRALNDLYLYSLLDGVYVAGPPAALKRYMSGHRNTFVRCLSVETQKFCTNLHNADSNLKPGLLVSQYIPRIMHTIRVLCCGYVELILPIFFRITSLALGQSYDCPSASEVTVKDMSACNTERFH